MQGLVLDWRRQSYRWSALVVTVRTDDEDRPVVVHEWLPAERLRPVKSEDWRPGVSTARACSGLSEA